MITPSLQNVFNINIIRLKGVTECYVSQTNAFESTSVCYNVHSISQSNNTPTVHTGL